MLVHLQVIIGVVAALFLIATAIAMALILIGASFKLYWPGDLFENLFGASALIIVGFGVAEAFLALARYAVGS